MASTALRRMVAALAHPYQTIVARNVTQRTCHSIAATAASRSEGSATAWQSGGRRGGGSSGGGAAMAAAAALFGSAMVIGSQSAQCDITETVERLDADLEIEHTLRKNPGSVEDVQRSCTWHMQTFDGFSAEMGKGFANSEVPGETLAISNSFALGKTEMGTPSGAYYHLAATYNKGPNMMQAVVAMDGNVYLTAVGKALEDKLEVSLHGTYVPAQPQMDSLVVNSTYSGEDYTAAVKVKQGGGAGTALSMSYMQSVTPDVALGADTNYVSAENKLGYAFTGKYNVDSDNTVVSSLDVPTRMLKCNYLRVVTSQLKLMSQMSMSVNPSDPNAEMAVGYEYVLREVPTGGKRSDGTAEYVPYTIMKGQLKDSGRMVVGLEHMTLGGQAKFKVCSSMQHAQRDYRFGVAVELNY